MGNQPHTDDDLATVLKLTAKAKTVTVHLRGGQTIKGEVQDVRSKRILIGSLSEVFIVNIEAIDAFSIQDPPPQ